MKKLLIALFVSMPLVGCTTETIYKPVPAPAPVGEAPPEETATPEEGADPADPAKDPAKPADPPAGSTADNCLNGQDMDAADVDISACPAAPSIPADIKSAGKTTSLGAWEIGTTADGSTYKYGTLSAPTTNPRTLSYDGGSVAVNAENVDCWAKGYYRLRKILQDPPKEWVALRDAGFQFRFFQFQSDLRNGPTGYKAIASFQDHLVKWVTVVDAKGVCQQPTLTKFRTYAKGELTTRKIALPQ